MPDIYAGTYEIFDITGPYVVNEFPSPNATCISPESSIGFDWLDSQTSPDTTTLNVAIQLNSGALIDVIINGVFQSGYDGAFITISGGYHIVIDPDDYLEEASYYTLYIDGKDILGNEMETHVWSFYTCRMFLTNSKCFLVNSKLKNVFAQSSIFQPRVKETLAGSYGNISLNVEQTLDLSSAETFEIRTVRSGRLDTKLNTQLLRETELGTGQITYNEERAVRGSFRPPKYVIEDANGDVYGLDLTMSKHIFSVNYSGNSIYSFAMCDRNDESFLIFTQRNPYPVVPYNPYAYSIAKVGKTDSNPVSGSVSVKSADDVVKVSENRYLIVTADYYNGTTHPNDPAVYFTMLDDSLTVIYESDRYHFLEYLEQNNIGTPDKGYLAASLYSDGNGGVYCVVSYSYNFSVANSLRTYFMRSLDGGYNWELIRAPGTNEALTVSNPVNDELGGLEPGTVTYQEQYNPKISYDDVNEYFILTYTTEDSSDVNKRRTVTMFSKDFVNWSRLNFPIYVLNVGTLSTAENLQVSSGMYRLKDKYWSIGKTNVTGNYKNSMCMFDYDNQVYGYRRGSFWNGSDSANDKGALIDSYEVDVFDDVMYLATNCHSDGGFTIHAIGVPTNLPDRTPYSHAYFGNHDAPNNSYGYSATTTGTPTTLPNDYGFRIELTSSDTAYYTYSALNLSLLRYNGFKFKAIVARSTDAGTYDSDIAQRIYVKVPTQDNLNHFYFTVRIGTNGIKLVNETTPTQNITHNQTLDVLEFVEILVIAVPRSDNTYMDIRMFVKDYADGTFEDTWVEPGGTNVFTITSGVATPEFSFGLKSAPSADSEYNWKAIYMVNTDLLDDIEFSFNDGLHDYQFGIDDDYLEPIPMRPEGVQQQSIRGMFFTWYGTDAIESDKWNFEVDSDFEADNMLTKAPSIGYRSANTTSDQTITFKAETDEIGMYIFDTIVFMHTNFRYVTIKANEDGTSWSPAPFEKTIDMTLDTGTIAATSEREDEDLLVVRCANKDWIPGELKDKYLMLERIYEPHNTTPALDNNYRNVAFKILDNGTDFILISTKGLLKDELNTDPPTHNYDRMRVLMYGNFLIYDTRIAVITNDPELHKYLRIHIDQSVSYSTLWGNNQPILPNERTWHIGEFDIGQRIHLTQDVSYPYEEEIDRGISIVNEDDGRIETSENGKQSNKFYLNYRVLHNDNRDELRALYESANESGEPFWYIPNLVNDPERVYLVVFNKEFSESRMLPEYQDIKMIFDEVV